MESRNIFLIVGIFIVGLVIGGIFSGSFTGRASNINRLTTTGTTIFISPAYAKVGDVLSITLDSRKCGASPIMFIRDAQGNRRDRVEWCRGIDDFGNPVSRSGSDEDSSCFSRVTYEYKLVGSYEPGAYYVDTYDICSRERVKAFFEIQ